MTDTPYKLPRLNHPVCFDADPSRKFAATSREGRSEIAGRVRRQLKLLNILSFLVTGWLPWGVDWRHGEAQPGLPYCHGGRGEPRRYIMCCGHTLTPARAQQLVSAGLLDEGPRDRFDRPTLLITEAGKVWLVEHWR